MKIKQKKGISLIVLVITIIVMIILAAAIILSLQSSGIIDRAKEAKIASDIANIKQEAEVVKSEAMLECQARSEVLTQEKLIEALSSHFKGSTVKQNTVTVENGKYDIVVGKDLSLSVSEKGKHKGIVISAKTTYALTDVTEGKNVYLEVDLQNAPEMRDPAEQETIDLLLEEFLNWLDWKEILVVAGKIKQPEASLTAEAVYNSELQSTLGVDYEAFEGLETEKERNELVKTKTGYETTEILLKYMLVGVLGDDLVTNGLLVLYANDLLPELIDKTKEEIEVLVKGWYNNEKTIDEITKEVAASLGVTVETFEEAYAALSVMLGITNEEAYVFSRKQAMMIVASGAYTSTHPVRIEYPGIEAKEFNWYLETSIEDESYTLTELGTYEIKVTGPSGNVEKIKLTHLPQITVMLKDVADSYVEVEITNLRYIAEDDVKEYRYYIKEETGTDYTLKATTQDTTYKFEGLTANTKYNILVEVEDNSGNIGKEVVTTLSTIPVPTGFTVSNYDDEDTVGEGLVIYKTTSLDNVEQETAKTTYDQFVWVPVTNMDKFKRTGWSNNVPTNRIDSWWTEPSSYNASTANQYSAEVAEYNKMKTSVEKYGGFYIARYEAGDSDVSSKRTTYTTGAHTVVSRKGAYIYNYVGWGTSMTDISSDVVNNGYNKGKGAVYLSQNMYAKNSNYTTTLIYGVQWDAALRWISDKYNVSDSRSWGNYATSTGDAATNSGSSNMNYTTGRNEAWKAKNIYDLAGNVWEWTMEASSADYRVYRGGGYSNYGEGSPASSRNYYYPSYAYYNIGFRPTLYIN